MDLVVPTDRGLYCPAGDFHIDPWRPVPRALITHAPQRPRALRLGSLRLPARLAPDPEKAAGRHRDRDRGVWRDADAQRRQRLVPSGRPCAGLGADPRRTSRRGLGRFGRLQARARRRVAPFEPVRCDTFITESTFGLPIYRWRPQARIRSRRLTPGGATTPRPAAPASSSPIRSARRSACSRMSTPRSGRSSATARSSRSTRCIAQRASPCRRRARHGHRRKADLRRALIIAPPSAAGSAWIKRFGDYSDAFASGWMQLRGNRRRRGLDRGFVLSDHADWPAACRRSPRPAPSACSRRTARSARWRAILPSRVSTRGVCRPPMARRRGRERRDRGAP